jgi:hypothetical protein
MRWRPFIDLIDEADWRVSDAAVDAAIDVFPTLPHPVPPVKNTA